MQNATKLKPARQRVGMLCAAWLSVVCIALLTGCATPPESGSPSPVVSDTQAPPERQAAPAPPPAAAKSDEAKTDKASVAGKTERERVQAKLTEKQAGTKPQSEPPAAEEGGCAKDSGQPAPKPSAAGPQPRWVCKQTNVTLDAVWRGKPADFTFEIGNEGEGDLKIKLKGG